jgi:glycosyltransferase involved in cell wall biosynthesis
VRVYLLEPYLTGSHRAWAEGYAAHSAHEIHIVSLPGQFWKWRQTGGFVTLAGRFRRAVERHGPPDVLVATSLLDLPGFLGLTRDLTVGVPAALYLHENQITYPEAGRTQAEERHGLISWTSLVAADAIAFNSDFHRDSLFDEVPRFLGAFPDERHGHLVEGVRARSIVLPVGVDLLRLSRVPSDRSDPPVILWNHRWDADKDPGAFFDALDALAADGVAFRVALCGERFARQADTYRPRIEALGDRVVADGELPETEYPAILAKADIVVSTALQEFFGMSIVEAIAAGAFPVLPDRLVYPERIPQDLQKRCLYGSPKRLVELLRSAVEAEDRHDVALRLARDMRRFDWSVVAPSYDDWIGSLRVA